MLATEQVQAVKMQKLEQDREELVRLQEEKLLQYKKEFEHLVESLEGANWENYTIFQPKGL